MTIALELNGAERVYISWKGFIFLICVPKTPFLCTVRHLSYGILCHVIYFSPFYIYVYVQTHAHSHTHTQTFVQDHTRICLTYSFLSLNCDIFLFSYICSKHFCFLLKKSMSCNYHFSLTSVVHLPMRHLMQSLIQQVIHPHS